ncbi:MAG: HypC/HybG/HupF family hydrogenase formation chaperone [Magnetococcales bacterium]|nr:HypC/HybG/HupF family hydrogenase formation chaperone [Magnetococcales bacterium]
MCLAVPMQLVAMGADETGTVELDGIQHTIGLLLIEDPKIGEYLLIHAGYAIERLDCAEAEARLALFRTLAEIQRQETGQEVSLVAPARKPGERA